MPRPKRSRAVTIDLGLAPQRKRARVVARRSIGRFPDGGLPKTQKATLRYVQFFTANPGSSIPVVNTFCSNGLFDPDITGSGHQPMGFDQWMGFYTEYQVVKSKIAMRFMPTNFEGDGLAPSLFGIKRDDEDGVLAGTANITVLEMNRQSAVHIAGHGNNGNTGLTQNTAHQTYSYSRSSSNKNIFADSLQRGSDSTNPGTRSFFHCWVMAVNGNDPVNTTYKITIDYDVIFTNPKAQVGS